MMETTWICPVCRAMFYTSMLPADGYCPCHPGEGIDLEVMDECARCGKPNPVSATVCWSCGAHPYHTFDFARLLALWMRVTARLGLALPATVERDGNTDVLVVNDGEFEIRESIDDRATPTLAGRVTVRRVHVLTVVGFAQTMGTRESPPDVDERDLGEAESYTGAIACLLGAIITDLAEREEEILFD
jgi:hypothetical protein